MEVRPGYRPTDVGVIPEEWEVCQLGRIAGLDVGYAFKSNWFKQHDGVPLLRGENVGYGRPDWSDTRRLSDDQTQFFGEYALRPGDIVIGMDRTFTKSGTKISLLQEQDCPSLLVQRVGRFVPLKCGGRFLWALLSATAFQQSLQAEQKGMDLPHLSRLEILRPLVAFPPTRAEQEAIAEALSDADTLIESLEQLVAKKRQVKQGTMQQLLTGKTRLPGFAHEWRVVALGELFDFSGGFTASRAQLSSVGYCYLHYGDIHGATKSFIDVRAEHQDIPKLDIPLKRVSSVSLLNEGDVVFVDASEDDEGASRHVVIVNSEGIPFIAGLHTIVAKARTNALEHKYRRYCFQTQGTRAQFRFFAVGTKVSGISKTNIAKITLSIPPVSEQAAIADILTDMDAEIGALEAKVAKARQLKQGMIQELLTGRTRLV